MISEKLVKVNVAVDTPEAAINYVGQLMVDGGLIEPRYVDGMQSVYKELGPYWVLTKGLAMPHARPEDGANASGLAVITLNQPISFGHEEHDPVSIVIGMSATDRNQHIINIQKLTSILSNKGSLESIRTAKNAEEILEIINR
ncbi:PTS sugar transporter subunit IIA [Aeromonas enteropelogenes]|uniref:PTS sugar transporter subunit IIA n=1 Tax=Aeromonas enteropelogenes TaxID=29489 RepID=UPI00313723E4